MVNSLQTLHKALQRKGKILWFMAASQSLPDFLANRLLARLLQTGSITPVYLPLFAHAAIVRIPPSVSINDGGAWLAALSRFR